MNKYQILPLACSHFGYVMVSFEVNSGNDVVARLKVVSTTLILCLRSQGHLEYGTSYTVIVLTVALS